MFNYPQVQPVEKEMAIHSSILAWKIPWMEEPGRGRKELDTTERLHFSAHISLHLKDTTGVFAKSLDEINILHALHSPLSLSCSSPNRKGMTTYYDLILMNLYLLLITIASFSKCLQTLFKC